MEHIPPEQFKVKDHDTVTISIGEKSDRHYRLHKEMGSLPDEGRETIDKPRWESELDEEVVETSEEEVAEAIAKLDTLDVIQDDAFMVSAETVRAYATAYKGGYMKFEKDFQTQWVATIQDPSQTEVIQKKGEKNKMDVFTLLSHVTVKEFNAVAALSGAELEEYLTEHKINPEDLSAWKMVMEYWQGLDELAFDEDTTVGDVARGAFAAKIEKDRRSHTLQL